MSINNNVKEVARIKARLAELGVCFIEIGGKKMYTTKESELAAQKELSLDKRVGI